MKIEKILYRGKSKATGGRDGQVSSADGGFEMKLTTPRELGGGGGAGTNPEQLFAAGYSACFIGAMKFVAGQEKIKLPDDLSITSTVGIGQIPGGFGIETEMQISAPGMDSKDLQMVVDKAHKVCPYSNATRGNMEVKFTLV